jgi:dipeptidyl-peptidase-4
VAPRDGALRLLVDDDAVTPPDVHVRAVVGVDDAAVTVTASYDDPAQVHVARWNGADLVRVTDERGVHGGSVQSGVLVLSSAALDRSGTRVRVIGDGIDRELTSVAEAPVLTPRVRLEHLGERGLRAGIVLPRTHRDGQRWPVLLDPYGGPHAQRAVAAQQRWLEPQWLADQGFAVVVADGRGTPGRGTDWERAIAGDFTVVLDDQIDALHAAAEVEPALDLQRVAIRGWSFGGYLAALAVLRRPDVFHAAVAGAPVTEWALYDTFYTERYLGHPAEQAAAYAHSSLLDDAPSLSRPLLIVHGLADDNVVAAHSLLLSQRLTEAGRPHAFLPLTGVTHMTPQEEVAENLLLLQVEFLQQALGVDR